MSRIVVSLAAALAIGLTAGAQGAAAATPCKGPVPAGGDWPAYGHDAANTRSQPAETGLTPAVVPGLQPAWVFSTAATGDTTSLQSTPVVGGGCVFVGSGAGIAYAIDASTGALVWRRVLDVPTAGTGGALVGAPALTSRAVIYLVSEAGAPYAVALDRATGAILWRSAPVTTQVGSYTNASAIVANGMVFFGFSAAEGDAQGQGGFALLDADTGRILKVTTTVPPADQAAGYAGGGLWSTPTYDARTRYAYIGAGNPFSRQKEHAFTNAILKIDLSRSRPTFGTVVASYKGNVDQYSEALAEASHTPVCAATDQPDVDFPLDDQACGQLDLDFGAAPNLFTDTGGRLLVGDLQKSGVYHVARADTMAPAWTALAGASCQVCNAASTAFDGESVIGVFTPGGVMSALARDDGAARWRAPIGDGVHCQGTSTAAGVAYTLDGNGFFDAFDARTGGRAAAPGDVARHRRADGPADEQRRGDRRAHGLRRRRRDEQRGLRDRLPGGGLEPARPVEARAPRAPGCARQPLHRLRLRSAEMRRQREEHLRGGQRVAERMVGTVRREPEHPRQLGELRRVRAGAPAGLGEPQPPERLGVDHALGEPHATPAQQRGEERALDPRDVDDHHPVGQCLDQVVEDVVDRRRVGDVGGPDPVHDDGALVGHPDRADEAMDRPADLDPALVDRHRGEREHLVGLGVQAGRLDVDRAIGRLGPGGAAHQSPRSRWTARCTPVTARNASRR